MRGIKAMARGKLRVWWLTNRHQAILALQVVFVVWAYLIASTMDYHDQVAAERSAKEQVARALQDERNARNLPPTVWLIEAKTPEKAQERLAQIAGQLDLDRARLRGLVP